MDNVGAIRPTALCVFRRGSRILVFRGTDPGTGEAFFRPFGGEIEFGERAEETIAREIEEELGARLEGLQLLGVLENHFSYAGRPGHEIVFVFDARFEPEPLPGAAGVLGRDDSGHPLEGAWMDLAEFADGRCALVPKDLLRLLLANR